MNSKAAYLCMTQTGYGTRLTARMKPLYRYLFAAMLPAAALSPMYASSPADTTVVTAKAPLPLPATGYEGRLLRSEFMSYTIRQNAANDDREAEWNYLPVENFTQSRTADGDIVYTATVELPEFWADRIIMLHCEGGRNSHRVSVNGTAVGSARDSGTPSEFELPNAVAGRTNMLRIELPADTDEPESGLRRQRADLTSCFLYSQPRTRIWDYDVSTVLTGSDGELTARVVVENRYPSEETFSLCFDVFSPEGRVEEYGTKRVTLPAGDRDTVTLRATIYGAGKKLWSAEKPALYRLTLFVRKGDRILEYVPVNVGFGTVSHAEGRVYRNGKPVELRPARCDDDARSAATRDSRPEKRGLQHALARHSAALVVLRYLRPYRHVRDRPGQHQHLLRDGEPAHRRMPEQRPGMAARIHGADAGDVPPLPHPSVHRRMVARRAERQRIQPLPHLSVAANRRPEPADTVRRSRRRMEQRPAPHPLTGTSPGRAPPTALRRRRQQQTPMGIDLILVGKTDSAEIAALMADYSKRISRYARFSVVFLPDVRNAGKLPVQIQKQAEGEMILRQTAPGDYVVLLDEKGTEMRSVEFAAWLGGKLTGSARRICFIVGGPYGFSGEVYARADAMLSLSRMTFSHQLVRTLFTEQLYRAFSILHHAPYHHE